MANESRPNLGDTYRTPLTSIDTKTKKTKKQKKRRHLNFELERDPATVTEERGDRRVSDPFFSPKCAITGNGRQNR